MGEISNSALRRARYLEEQKKVQDLIEWAEFYKQTKQYAKAKIAQIEIENAKRIRDQFRKKVQDPS